MVNKLKGGGSDPSTREVRSSDAGGESLRHYRCNNALCQLIGMHTRECEERRNTESTSDERTSHLDPQTTDIQTPKPQWCENNHPVGQRGCALCETINS